MSPTDTTADTTAGSPAPGPDSTSPRISSPAATGGAISETNALARLTANARRFRDGMTVHKFDIPAGEHPIVPILLGDAARAVKMAELLLAEGIYVIAFSYPVVPQGKARIRVQISAAHTRDDLDRAVPAFVEVATKHGALHK